MSRSARQTAAFSLFTFLDVMLCTLGALIIVLICVVRTAQMKNSDEAPQNAAEVEEIVSQRETIEWRAKHLAKSRDETRAQLQDRRLELSHIEEHSRRLRAQLGELELAENTSEGKQRKEKVEQLRTELAHVTELAAAAERELEEARRTAESKRPSYAVVPYEGPSQTMRRPLYIECTAEKIILQPEGIELTQVDFEGPLGPGNPLAAGLRAAREYLDDYGDNAADAGEPYPLLLVRPDGVEAYYQAREAMTSWGSEFGYELIDQDWKLEFRPAQPAMVDCMKLAVEEARVRQIALARAAPRFYAEKKKAQWYRASPGGGIVQESGPSDDEAQQRRGYTGRPGGNSQRGSYAGGGYGGRGNRGGGNGSERQPGSGRYPAGTNTGPSSTDGNSDTELASVYGAAANSNSGTGPRGGGGNAPNGSIQGNGSGQPRGGINPNGNGAGNSMFASGTGSGTGPRASMTDGSSSGSGTGSGNGPSLLGSGAGGGDSFLTSGTGAGPLPATTALPGSARGQPGANDLTGGGSGNGVPAMSGDKTGTLAGGFNGNTYGSGTATQLASGSQGVGGSATAPGTTTTGTTSAANGTSTGNGTTGGAGSAGAGSEGAPNGPYAKSGDADGKGAPANSQASGQGVAGQTGPGKLGMQPGGTQAAGAASGQAGSAASGAAGNPGGQAGMVSASTSQSSPLSIGGQSGASASSGGAPTSVQFGSAGQGTATSSMADKRGKNWGLPEEARHAVPIQRPVRVECLPDRLVLRSEQSSSQTQEIPLTEHTEDSVEDLVAAVWNRVDTWGSAGRGMYWRPQLAVDVAPGAEGRYADLKTLLADSGLDVKPADKKPAQVARPKKKIGPW